MASKHWTDTKDTTLDSSAFTLTSTQATIVEAAREFGENWAPFATDVDRNDSAPVKDMVRDTVSLGLTGLTIPTNFGGGGHSAIEFASRSSRRAVRRSRGWQATSYSPPPVPVRQSS